MDDIVRVIANALFQIAVFALIPFIAWLIWQRKKVGFFEYVGLKRPRRTASWWAALLLLALYLSIYLFADPGSLAGDAKQAIQSDPNASAYRFAGMGAAAVIPVSINTFIQNGFCEELLFRGFVCKRLIKHMGTKAGIVAQAVVFALVHNLMLWNVVPDIWFHLFLFATITVQAAVLAIFNEKVFDGSIWPSVLIHGLGNFCTTMQVALMGSLVG